MSNGDADQFTPFPTKELSDVYRWVASLQNGDMDGMIESCMDFENVRKGQRKYYKRAMTRLLTMIKEDGDFLKLANK